MSLNQGQGFEHWRVDAKNREVLIIGNRLGKGGLYLKLAAIKKVLVDFWLTLNA